MMFDLSQAELLSIAAFAWAITNACLAVQVILFVFRTLSKKSEAERKWVEAIAHLERTTETLTQIEKRLSNQYEALTKAHSYQSIEDKQTDQSR